jgi:hypothetical protein
MRNVFVIAFCLMLWASSARAMTIDPKALARYDISYVSCEAKFPQMTGHRDEAYLNLWRVKPDAKALDQLAAIRSAPAYRGERQRLLRAAGKPVSAAASSSLERECQGLWADAQKTTKPKR